jgi:O-antigen ligase
MKAPYLQVGFGLLLGAGMGLAVALLFGSRGLWLALGLAIGVVIGVWAAHGSAKHQLLQEKPDLWTEKPDLWTEKPQ